MTDNRTSPSGKRVEATVDSVAEIREFTNNPPSLVWLKGGGGFDRYEHTTEVDDGVNNIVVGNFVFVKRTTLTIDGSDAFSVATDSSLSSVTYNGTSSLAVNRSGDTADPFELSYLLRVSAETQPGADGAVLTSIASLVGPTVEIVTGSPTLSLTGFGGSKGIQFPFSPRGVMRQALPSVFSSEKPFSLFAYCTLGTLGAVAKYLFGFGAAAGATRCILFSGSAGFINTYWSIVSTATDAPPQSQIQRAGGNVYQGRRWADGQRALVGLIYDGTHWSCVLNGVRMALSAGYGYTPRTAGAIAHDGYVYFNGAAYSGLDSYCSNPMLREMSLIDHAASDAEIAQYWRYLAVQSETSVYCIGDSITWGSTASTDATLGTLNGYPQQLQELDLTRVITNWGKVADKTSQMLSRLDSALRYFLPRNRGSRCVAMILAGANDLISTTDTAAQIYSRIVAICASARLYACGTQVVCTVLPSTSFTAGRETVRLALNAMILAGAGIDFTAASNIAVRANLANPANATYYTDGLHPTTLGYGEIAAGASATLATLSL